MTRRKILRYPDPRLLTVAKPVTRIDDALRRLIDDMTETMYGSGGIGLAATQIDVHQRVIVMDVSQKRDQLVVLINPVILAAGGSASHDEGCLSVPGTTIRVRRPAWIQVQALDREGDLFEVRADDWEAVCIQHEIEHLDGIVFTDYLPVAQQEKLRKQLATAGNRRR
ncbi:peptide deformylase [uncultured Oxalicibacterium sp.]|uniref:peptide deformylase n=1 Tax=uncultured Oxalicibacterium sp. TaxID=1168540 RepID=UPI0025CD3449|nr:peptide deformylase [uncultured Oxalicibacterium sp.]